MKSQKQSPSSRAVKSRPSIHLTRLFASFSADRLNLVAPIRRGSKRHCLPGSLVVSLTSYSRRFQQLPLTITSLLRQTTTPDRLILWISEAERHLLPDEVMNLQRYGLTIAYCPDILSYKKLIPSLKMFPNAFIMTVDDDLYLYPNWLKDIIAEYSGEPNMVICARAHRIALDQGNKLAPYARWGYEEGENNPSRYNFPTSGAGVLFPPNVFHPSVFDTDMALGLCHKADDVWIYWMFRLTGAMAKTTRRRHRLVEWKGTQSVALWRDNVHGGGNDRAIEKLCGVFGFPI